MSARSDTAAQRGWMKPVISRRTHIPHASFLAKRGDRYLVRSSGYGDFRSHINEIAEWDGQDWVFAAPKPGDRVLVEDEDAIYIYKDVDDIWSFYGSKASVFPMLTMGNGNTTLTTNSLTTTSNQTTTYATNNLTASGGHFVIDVPPKAQLTVGDVVWHKISKHGPYVLISKRETDFYREIPSNSGRRDEVSLTSIRVDDTWVVLDRRGRLQSIPGAALTKEKPERLTNKALYGIFAVLMIVFFPAVFVIWLTSQP